MTWQRCRLRLDNRELRKRGGGLFGANPMTGSIGVVTINMPRIGYYQTQREYFERLPNLWIWPKKASKSRKILEKFTDSERPYSRYYLQSVKQRFGEYWKIILIQSESMV